MTNRKKLPQAIRFALLAGSVSLVAGNAFAQDQTQDQQTTDTQQKASTLEKIEVTGSRIKRAEVEGALPVTVITRKDIEVSGKTTVADLLQNSTFNSFGSNKPTSGSSAQSMSELSLRGLGGGRSLLLIDGRRAPLSPQFSEAGSDLNSIPLSAVERVEILSDGASAIYGADAIGGVVNVITRKDFNGVEVTAGVGDGNYGGDTEEGSVLMGTSSDRGRLLGGVSYNNREIAYVRDKPWMKGILGPSSFSNNYTQPVINPITGETTYGAQIGPVPGGCDNPGFYVTHSNTTGLDTCRYDYNLFAADTAQLKQKGAFVKGDFQINDDWTVYMNSAVTQVESFGRFAPALADHGLFITAASPNNTTGQDVVLKHRFAALGPRDNFDTSTVLDATVGFNWQASDKVSLDFGIRRAQSKYANFGYNYVNVPIAQALIESGEYNIFNPIGNSEEVLNKMRATISRDSHFNDDEVYALANIDLFDLAGGTSGLAVGVEHHKQDFADNYDAQSAAGNIGGSSGNSSFGGRSFNSAYFEWLLPFTSWFEADLAGRYDHYSDFGTSTVPKVSVRFHPLDNLTFRASYGEGFRAPPLVILNQQAAFSADTVVDGPTAIALGYENPNTAVQIDGLRVATPDLKPEDSKQWSAGVVYDPTDWLSLKLDYYNIKLNNTVKFFSAQTVINRTNNGQFVPSNLYVLRDPTTQQILQVAAGYANEGFIHTDGFDFNAATKFDLGSFGSLKNNLQFSYIRKYEAGGGDATTTDYIGTTDYPRWRATLTNQWEKGDFSLVWTINGMQQTPSYTSTLLADYGYSCQQSVDYGYENSLSCKSSYFTHDVSASMKTPWNGKITLGAINVTNKYPRIDQFGFTPPYYNQNLYWGYGRQIYLRYTQSF